jgi:hypothetical protein
MKTVIEHIEVRAVEDAAWSVKDCAADLFGRALTDADRAVLASVQRDLERLHERLVEVRDRRRRKRNGAVAAQESDVEAAQQPLPTE